MEPRVKLFSGTATQELAEKIAASYGTQLGKVSLSKFSDGEFQPSFEETVRGSDIFIIQSTVPPADNLMELLLMVDAARRASADKIIAVVPYYGFARQDRKDKPRVPIAAKLIANMLSTAGITRLMTMDLHADQIQGFMSVPVDHLYGSSIFIPYLEGLNLPNLAFASPDVGGTRRAKVYAKYFNVDFAMCYKQRKVANVIDSMTIIGDVEGKDVVLVDDMVDTAGTLAAASQVMMDNGATSVRAIATHPLLSGNAYENIENSALEELAVCDTIPLSRKSNKINVLTVSDLFADVIRKVYNYESISSFFIA